MPGARSFPTHARALRSVPRGRDRGGAQRCGMWGCLCLCVMTAVVCAHRLMCALPAGAWLQNQALVTPSVTPNHETHHVPSQHEPKGPQTALKLQRKLSKQTKTALRTPFPRTVAVPDPHPQYLRATRPVVWFVRHGQAMHNLVDCHDCIGRSADTQVYDRAGRNNWDGLRQRNRTRITDWRKPNKHQNPDTDTDASSPTLPWDDLRFPAVANELCCF
jgi:hypothetical protein